MEQFIEILLVFLFVVVPVILTVINAVLLVLPRKKQHLVKENVALFIEMLTIILGILLTILYLSIINVTNSDWWVVLVNNQRHTPIASKSLPTIITLAVLGLGGYLILRLVPLNKLTPLLIAFSIAALYLGMFLATLWGIQMMTYEPLDYLLLLFPINCLLIGLKTIKLTVEKWRNIDILTKATTDGMIHWLYLLVSHSRHWYWLGFMLALPLLGLVIIVLALFGQEPDSIIQAWTQTSNWRLSQQISPPNVQYDEHYLCTVAANGHRKIVKPQRMGIRHGHIVTVNRQLCIANAFEQVLAEKMPNMHKKLRWIYDILGFPIAQKITSPVLADIIYFFMKPAEYFFLFILYLVDVKPENRIALQYITKDGLKLPE